LKFILILSDHRVTVAKGDKEDLRPSKELYQS
jgi:hypothetical protein